MSNESNALVDSYQIPYLEQIPLFRIYEETLQESNRIDNLVTNMLENLGMYPNLSHEPILGNSRASAPAEPVCSQM